MRTSDKIRLGIINAMEVGRGSKETFPHPVSLEPVMKPLPTGAAKKYLVRNRYQDIEKKKSFLLLRSDSSHKLQFIRIKPSSEDKNSLEIAGQFILSLPGTHLISYEVICRDKKIQFQLAVKESQTDLICSQFRSHFPNAEGYITEDLISNGLQVNSSAHAYRLKSSHFRPLDPVSALDPYRSLFGFLANLDKEQTAVLQVIFVPVAQDFYDNMSQASRHPYDQTRSPFIDIPDLPKIVDKKLEKPLYAVTIRMLASSASLLSSMERFLTQFDDGENGLVSVSGAYPVQSIVSRTTYVHGMILNLTELSYFLHLPDPDLLNSMPCIALASKSYPVPEAFTAGGPILGYNLHQGIKTAVCHSISLPNQHAYSIGKSGYGKSNLILYAALKRLVHDGVAIIDPHGSLIRQGILPRIPRHRAKDVVYFNAGDYEYPMSINVLAHGGTKQEKEHIRVDLLSFFEDLFEMSLGVNVQHALNFFIVTLLTRQDSTLSDIERLMIDENWRNSLLDTIDDQRIHKFWEQEFPLLEKRGIVTAITNKISPLVLPDSTIGSMITQRENRIDFLEIMNNKKIFLCNLSHGDIGKRNSQLLGKLIVSKLQIAAMMREGSELYPDFFVYIDEFQHMACPSMADILSGARKYGMHLWLANQMVKDIPDHILRHVFNAATLIFFATDAPSDQMLIEKTLSRRFKAEDIGQLKRGETYVKMVNSAFNMKTELVPDHPPDQWVDDIIASSRTKYSVKEEASSEYKHASSVTSPRRVNHSLSSQEKTFLHSVLKNPSLSVTNLYKNQGLSAYMGDKLKTAMKSKSLVQEVSTHLGSGSRIAKFLLLTPAGFDALGENLSSGSGKGGLLHRYWQSVIQFHAEGKGYRAAIEELIPGGQDSVDVGLERNGGRIAVEVSVTTSAKHEINNTRKCLDAGYGRIVVLFLDEDKMSDFQSLTIQAFTKDEQLNISIGLTYDFCSFF